MMERKECWMKIMGMWWSIVIFFTNFLWTTLKVSNTLQDSSNMFFHQITNIEGELHKTMAGDDTLAHNVVCKMKVKYEKYYGNCEKMNMLMFITFILDPQFKLDIFNMCLKRSLNHEEKRAYQFHQSWKISLKLFVVSTMLYNKENDTRNDVQLGASQPPSTRLMDWRTTTC